MNGLINQMIQAMVAMMMLGMASGAATPTMLQRAPRVFRTVKGRSYPVRKGPLFTTVITEALDRDKPYVVLAVTAAMGLIDWKKCYSEGQMIAYAEDFTRKYFPAVVRAVKLESVETGQE